ncbi:hypothetical protein PG995_004824 [Apiospora arundinis]
MMMPFRRTHLSIAPVLENSLSDTPNILKFDIWRLCPFVEQQLRECWSTMVRGKSMRNRRHAQTIHLLNVDLWTVNETLGFPFVSVLHKPGQKRWPRAGVTPLYVRVGPTLKELSHERAM